MRLVRGRPVADELSSGPQRIAAREGERVSARHIEGARNAEPRAASPPQRDACAAELERELLSGIGGR